MTQLDQGLQTFRQTYVDLRQEEEENSDEYNAYNMILRCIDSCQHATIAYQRASEILVHLNAFAQEVTTPNQRKIIRDAIKELKELADPPLPDIGANNHIILRP